MMSKWAKFLSPEMFNGRYDKGFVTDGLSPFAMNLQMFVLFCVDGFQ